MQTGTAGIELIKSFEGIRLNAYKDSAGVWTIGYGHTNNVYNGMTITSEEAETLLKNDLKQFEYYVNTYVSVNINQNQFDALVSFTYNVGGGAFKQSTLLEKLNNGDMNGAADEFGKWIYAGGIKLNGLIRRRNAERELFLKEIIERDEEMEKIYNWTLEVPECGRPTIQKLLDKGYLHGNEKGELRITETALQVYVVNDRAGCYD